MDRQCPSCGGFCKKSGCERENAKREQEPVAWSDVVSNGGFDPRNVFDFEPPKREWVGLTDEDYDELLKGDWGGSLIQRVEAKLKEKNS